MLFFPYVIATTAITTRHYIVACYTAITRYQYTTYSPI